MIYIVILVCLHRAEALFENRVLGPADLKFQYLEPCDKDVEEPFRFALDQKKYNRTVYIWEISMDTEYLVDDTLTVEVNLAVKKQGGYKQGAFYMYKPLCEALKTMIGDIYKEFLTKAAGVDDCPVPPGSYTMKDFHFDNSEFTIPQLYGEYEMTSYIYKDEQRISCLRAYYELARKGSE
ncbi:uncharacterized protein LOC121738275 [Aricia agestis]|uniref:uncharacterized protein LOC121738275 n=1 Tax=Aricia agestis TaxID=91739 RepID=UPI001C20AC7B|nr:uncharacterized protein LOC121738275 [Aricia agestis]